MTVSEVVDAFFEAREDGDCERLLGLISEVNWSDGGARSSEEFLEQCAEALEGFEPYTPGVSYQYVGADGEHLEAGDSSADHVLVWLGTGRTEDPHFYYTGNGADYRGDDEEDLPEGRLVREGGEWRVVTDEVVFHIGPAVHEMISDYIQAWSQGDCERLLSYVSDGAWSAGDERTSPQFVEQCSEAAQTRQPIEGGPSRVEASFSEDGLASATVIMTIGDEAETVMLTREGLRWKLDRNEDLSAGASPGTLFNWLRYRELEPQMLDSITVGGETCSGSIDHEEAEEGEAPGVVVRREYCDGLPGVHVTVQEHADAAEASAAAEQKAQELLNEEPPAATEGSVRERRPNQPADVPGTPQALAVRSNCDADGCARLNAFLPHGHMVIQVEMSVLGDFQGGNLNDVEEILAGQRDLLALY